MTIGLAALCWCCLAAPSTAITPPERDGSPESGPTQSLPPIESAEDRGQTAPNTCAAGTHGQPLNVTVEAGWVIATPKHAPGDAASGDVARAIEDRG